MTDVASARKQRKRPSWLQVFALGTPLLTMVCLTACTDPSSQPTADSHRTTTTTSSRVTSTTAPPTSTTLATTTTTAVRATPTTAAPKPASTAPNPNAKPPNLTPSASTLADLTAFAVCMRAQGISDFPNPNPDGSFSVPDSVLNSPQTQSAYNTCLPTANGALTPGTGGNVGGGS
jgi:hypothetical protein